MDLSDFALRARARTLRKVRQRQPVAYAGLYYPRHDGWVKVRLQSAWTIPVFWPHWRAAANRP